MTGCLRGLALPLVLLVLSQDCHAMPFSQDMVGNQLIAGRVMRPKAAGSVPLGSLERQIPDASAALPLSNPLEKSHVRVAAGERLFSINCSPCHGSFAADGSHVFSPLLMKGMPSINLNDPAIAGKPDGHFFGYMHKGGALMPPYGWKLSNTEMWEIVAYLRSVQTEAKTGKPGR